MKWNNQLKTDTFVMIVRERSVMTSGGAILQHMESAKIF